MKRHECACHDPLVCVPLSRVSIHEGNPVDTIY